MDIRLYVLLVIGAPIYYMVAGYGCLVMAKTSSHIRTESKGNVIILLFWPLILILAAFEA